MKQVALCFFVVLSFFSCQQDPTDLIDYDTDLERLEAIWTDIQLEISDKSCSRQGACKVMAFGQKACGGPAGYLVYSSGRVNENKLKELVSEYTALQTAMNQAYGLMSDCSVPSPPDVSCMNGQCE